MLFIVQEATLGIPPRLTCFLFRYLCWWGWPVSTLLPLPPQSLLSCTEHTVNIVMEVKKKKSILHSTLPVRQKWSLQKEKPFLTDV